MIVLDTNVISELMRASPSEHVRRWLAAQSPSRIFTTAVTQAELFYRLELMPVGKKREALKSAAAEVFRDRFTARVLAFDAAAAQIFAVIAAGRRALGRPIGQFDGQIAAIARSNRAIVATRDMSDFADCGVELINPWT